MGETGDDERQLHLGEGEPDAHPWAATERNPAIVRDSPLDFVEAEETVGIEAVGVSPCLGVPAGEVGRPEYERSLRDRVGTDGHIRRTLGSAGPLALSCRS